MNTGTYTARGAVSEVAASSQTQSADAQLGLGVTSSIGVGGSIQSSLQRQKVYVRRQVEGQARMEIAGDAILSGFILDADQVRINALNLVLESLQDEASMSGGQASVRLDPFSLGQLKNLVTSIGGGMNRQMSRWVQEVSRIVGQSGIKIVVDRVLRMAGSLIAHAEQDPVTGQLTDRGRLMVQAADIVVEDIANYDRGVTLSVMASHLASKLSDGLVGRSYRGGFGFHVKDGATRSTGGLGDWIIAGAHKSAAELGLATNLNAPTQVGADISLSPIHWRYASINWKAVQDAQLLSPERFMDRVNAGLEPLGEMFNPNWFSGLKDEPNLGIQDDQSAGQPHDFEGESSYQERLESSQKEWEEGTTLVSNEQEYIHAAKKERRFQPRGHIQPHLPCL